MKRTIARVLVMLIIALACFGCSNSDESGRLHIYPLPVTESVENETISPEVQTQINKWNSNGYKFHTDGSPSAISLSIQFMETELLTQKDYTEDSGAHSY